ncbi:MAG TPA: CvpA family protein [Candidatus Krumholzibacteria bacterium]|nr:CvpA family protein [Candidatus Krumholzibacteria bacterium]
MEPAVWIALALIAGFAIWGFKDGVVKRVVEIVGALLTLMLTARFAAAVTPRVAGATGWSESVSLLVAWVLMIFVGLVLSRLLARLISKAVRLTVLGWVDRLGGAVCGAALGMLVASILLLALGVLPGGPELQAAYRKDAVGAVIIDSAPNVARQAKLVAGDRFAALWDQVTREADAKADAAADQAKRTLDEAKDEVGQKARDAVK